MPDDAELSEKLMSGEAWAEYCDRLKAVGQRMLGGDYPGTPKRTAG